MNQKINDHIRDGAIIITISQRLAHYLKEKYADQQRLGAKTAWLTPRCLTWSAWCKQQFNTQVERQHKLLNRSQQYLLWQKIIRQSKYNKQLLVIHATTQQVMSAYAMCRQWYIPIFPDDTHHLYLAEEHEAFKLWASNYDLYKQAHNYVDEAELPDYLVRSITQGSATLDIDRKIVFYGFDQFTAQQKYFIDFIKSYCSVEVMMLAEQRNQNQQAYELKNIKEEIRSAAHWARQQLEHSQQPLSIGIVVPKISKHRKLIDYCFRDILAPQTWLKPSAPSSLPYTIAIGKPLLEWQLIHTATLLLSLATAPIKLSTVQTLLHSSFWYRDEDDQRAMLAIWLQGYHKTYDSMQQLITVMSKAPVGCPKLLQKLKQFDLKSSEQAYSKWGKVYSHHLDQLGWLEGHSLSSEEYQIVEKFKSILAEFATLDAISPSVDYKTALSTLKRLLREVNFQPQTSETSIQILETVGAAAMQFDYLWLLGVNDKNYPPPKEVNPFVPLVLQHKILKASADGQLKLARKQLDDLINSATTVIFSYAKDEDSSDHYASPLLSNIKFASLEVIDNHNMRLYSKPAAELESFHDVQAPAMMDLVKVKGGVSIIKDQIACPFRAFAKHRLMIPSLVKPEDSGISAIKRGQLVHQCLAMLWQHIKDSDSLQCYQPTELNDLISDVVAKVLTPDIQPDILRDVEYQRLVKLCSAWLAYEHKCKLSFKVIATEKEKQIKLADLIITIRIDRIDQLENGDLVLIDYKTGDITVTHLDPKALYEPQLPIYAMNTDHCHALLFACLKPDGLAFKGYADKEILKTVRVKEDWQVLIEQWQNQITATASAFKTGDASVVRMDKKVCQYCDLHSLCRIDERTQSIGDG